jgi:hypothetical protein
MMASSLLDKDLCWAVRRGRAVESKKGLIVLLAKKRDTIRFMSMLREALV